MAQSGETGARMLGVQPPAHEPSPAALALVETALDGAADDGELAGPGFDDYVAALARFAPVAASRLAAAGVTGEVLDDTLADVGRKIRTYGDDGIRGWAIELMRGDVVTLGRLQFERVPGAHGRSIHIPELGPLDPASVDDALDRARHWFGDGAPFCCASWLLDPRLVALGEASNLVRFQRRFRLIDSPEPPTDDEADRSVTKFVFRRSPDEVLGLDTSAMSSLQRLVAYELRRGGHWTELLGVLREEAAGGDPWPGR